MPRSYYLIRLIHGSESPLAQIVSSSHTREKAQEQLEMTRDLVDPEARQYVKNFHYLIWEGEALTSDQAIKRAVVRMNT